MTEQDAYGEPTEDGRRPLLRSGAEGDVDAEDVALASGQDPTPDNVARARRRLDEEGKAAAEKLVE